LVVPALLVGYPAPLAADSPKIDAAEPDLATADRLRRRLAQLTEAELTRVRV
jgi:hypothetical protein